ncbi:SpoIIE family protein phosphatase [Kitasatospora sp. DSM 101779]|uniref:SpoIIE family protein phosphatase n=1 Tax=Kitasatospora sp. DSM 101779 TaxID=2853165 RepID=UPI0021D945AE|nr:SpoIIE family protein phosphatase [Kitasatospora sp. DSM 101779]MCU7826833.1 SpoIIE family protein phosphatase [Kitasatospora sp. DSM 101779]
MDTPAEQEPRHEPAGPDAELDAELTATVRRTGASAGAVHLLGRDPVLVMAVSFGLPSGLAAAWRRIPLGAPLPVSDAVRDEEFVWVGSQQDLARAYPRLAAALPHPLALAAAPLTGARRVWGALLLLFPADHPQRATPRERGHITGRARRLARLLDDAEHPPTLPDRPRTAPDPPAGPEPAQPPPAAADFAERLPGASLALDLEGRIAYASAGAGRLLGRTPEQLLGALPWLALPWLDDPAVEDRYRTAVISREPAAFTALRPPDTWLDFRLYPDRSGISIRVTTAHTGPDADGRTVPAHGPPPEDEHPGGRLYQLLHLAAALTEAVGVRDVVETVAEQVLPAFGADGLVLSAVDAGRLKIIGHCGYPSANIDRLDGLPLDTRLTPAGQVLATGSPAFFSDPDRMADLYPGAPQMSGKHAWAVLPLIVSGRPVGVCILSYNRSRTFSADERAVLTSLAGLLAQALDRARLYDAKHDLADDLQHALLPHSLPQVPGITVASRYLAATRGLDVGGDFYDFIRLDERTAAAVIGDVQGHNTTAAALMGQVRTAVHAHATAGAAPDEVLARTNRLLADLDPDLLVSCLYAQLDLTRRQATVASAGHPPPLLRRPNGHSHVLTVEAGPLLGAATEAVYPLTTLPLLDGTLLALYTDGLVEVPGTDASRTTAELAGLLSHSRAGTPDRLIDDLVHHSWPTGRQTDDIAVLVLDIAPGGAARYGTGRPSDRDTPTGTPRGRAPSGAG